MASVFEFSVLDVISLGSGAVDEIIGVFSLLYIMQQHKHIYVYCIESVTACVVFVWHICM